MLSGNQTYLSQSTDRLASCRLLIKHALNQIIEKDKCSLSLKYQRDSTDWVGHVWFVDLTFPSKSHD